MLVAVFLIAYFNFGRRKYVLLWAMCWRPLLNVGSNIFFTSYEGLLAERQPDVDCAYDTALAGHRLRVGLRNLPDGMRHRPQSPGLATAWFTLADVHVGLRTGIVPLYTALMMSVLTATVLQSPPRAAGEWGLAVVACASRCASLPPLAPR